MAWFHSLTWPSVTPESVERAAADVGSVEQRLKRIEQQLNETIVILRRLEMAIAQVNVRQNRTLRGRCDRKSISLRPVGD